MCVAVPGKIIEMKENIAKVDIRNNIFEVDTRLVTVNIGDYVLVHAGCALEVLTKDRAEEIIWIFNELEEALQDESTND